MNKLYVINQPIKKSNELNVNNNNTKNNNDNLSFSNKINILSPSDIKFRNYLFSEKKSFSEKKNTYDSSSISTIDNSKRKFKKKRKYNEINKFPFPTENNNNFNNENEFLKKQCKYY